MKKLHNRSYGVVVKFEGEDFFQNPSIRGKLVGKCTCLKSMALTVDRLFDL